MPRSMVVLLEDYCFFIHCFVDVAANSHGGMIIFINIFSSIFEIEKADLTEEDFRIVTQA